jgi:hypothetical protein
MNPDLLKLPWEIQLALASGYVAYVLAYTGLRDRQRTIDVVFISLVFGLIATLVLWLLSQHGPIIAGLLAFLISAICGVVWRKLVRPLVATGLRKFNVSWSDDAPSALATLSENTEHPVSQAAILLDDGTWLCCEETYKFANSPFGPVKLGPNGDVALYVTTITSPDGTSKPQTTIRDAYYGDRITYIPASRIKQITLRHLPDANRFSRVAVAAHSAQSPLEQAEPLAKQ